jgi:ribosomal-protein-alanine N-acetyltransferase
MKVVCQPLLLPDSQTLERLLQIESEAFPYETWSESRLSEHLSQADGTVQRRLNLGLYQGDELIGFIISGGVIDELELYQIAIAKQHQGMGHGRVLLSAFLRWASSLTPAIERILLEVNTHNQAAIGLYQSHGFTTDGHRKGYYTTPEGRQDACLMSYTFPSS